MMRLRDPLDARSIGVWTFASFACTIPPLMPIATSPRASLLLLALGAAGLCAAALAAAVSVAGRAGLSPGRRALLHWIPIATAVVVARMMGWPDISLGIIFGTSVAVLSTVVGSLCMTAPIGPAPARWKRLWPFTL